MEKLLTVRRVQHINSPSEESPTLTNLSVSRVVTNLSIKKFDSLTRNIQEKPSSLNGLNYLYDTDDSESDSGSSSSDSEKSEISEKRNPFTNAVEEYKKKTILLGSARKNKHLSPKNQLSNQERAQISPRNDISQNVKTSKKILEKHHIDELKTQVVDNTCFIANIIKGSPSSKKESSFTNTPPQKKEIVKNAIPKEKDGLRSILDEHKLDIEELEFLEVTSSEDEETVESLTKEKINSISEDPVKIDKESAREYFERLLQDAKKKEPKEVRDYERMADYALEKSLDSLKKTIDDVDITKTDTFQHISQRRRMYDSLKRGLGARDFMVGVAGSSEAADELLSKIGLSPIAPKTPSSPHPPISPNTPRTLSPASKDIKQKRTKEEDERVLERLSKPRSHQMYRKNDENKSITQSVATLSEEFLDRMKNFEEMKKLKLEELRSQMNNKRNQESSFSPRINNNSKTIHRNIHSLLSWQKEKNMKQEKLILQKQETESIIDCTFSPEISERSQKLAKRKPNIPLAERD